MSRPITPSDPTPANAVRRRDLMKPVQLLGLAFAAALFAGAVTAMSMGLFQRGSNGQGENALVVALIVAGVTFIVVLLVLALLLLVVDPADVSKTLDRPVLLPREQPDAPPAAPHRTAGDDEPPLRR